MNVFQEIDYWINELQEELKIYTSPQKQLIVRSMFIKLAEQGNLFYHLLEYRKGIIVYCIYPDYMGELSLLELFMYIKPQYRGSYKLFRQLINHIEEAAKDYNCRSVRVGANIKYKDEKILKVLQKLGYATDTVVKYI